jgi:hypothetical protein
MLTTIVTTTIASTPSFDRRYIKVMIVDRPAVLDALIQVLPTGTSFGVTLAGFKTEHVTLLITSVSHIGPG